MKKMIMYMLFFLAVSLQAIGFQHGIFRSQSTQGKAWQGSATIVDETYRITVYPNYLAVELDWEIEVGGEQPDSFSNALEIVGNINLVEHSVVTGLFTWWKDDILHGKLKTKQQARAEYEEVVDRDAEAPPPPRDPVLLEYGFAADNYDISIFPATFGQTRKVRIAYLIPGFSVNGIMQMNYPYAFSDNASVFIKASAEIDEFTIQTSTQPFVIQSDAYTELSAQQISFSPYSSVRNGSSISLPIIQSIVPTVQGLPNSAIVYAAPYSSELVSGEFAHVVPLSMNQVLSLADFKQDIVILWRWNHPEILQKFGKQIVQQSQLLQEFITQINTSTKRVGLCISKQGSEPVTFELGAKGSQAYKALLRYLESLSDMSVAQAPVTDTEKTYPFDFDLKAAQLEFEHALQQAITLFEKASDARRYLLFLTAGPQLFNEFTGKEIRASIEQDVTVDMFERFLGQKTQTSWYWPGVLPPENPQQADTALKVIATVSNGSQKSTIFLSGIENSNATQRLAAPIGVKETQQHLFSDNKLSPEISYSVYQKGTLLSTFEQTAHVLQLQNGDHYAQLLAGSRYLHSLANELPRSMAATFGFVDTAYALVALEQDALSPEQKRLYEDSGMLALQPGDIHPAEGDRKKIPSAQWLEIYPPAKITLSPYYSFLPHMRFGVPEAVALDDAVTADPQQFQGDRAMPAADQIDQLPTSYYDYSEALSIHTAPPSASASPASAWVSLGAGYLIIDLLQLKNFNLSQLQLAVFDISGRLIHRIQLVPSAGASALQIPFNKLKLSRGVFLVSVHSGSRTLHAKITLP